MEYNEKYFKASANKKARMVWIILLVLITLGHAPQIGKGISVGNFIIMIALGWLPYLFGRIMCKLNGDDYIFLIKICVLNDAVLLLSALILYIQGTIPEGYVNDLPLEISTITLCYIGCILSVKHITSSNDALTGSIQGNLERVVKTRTVRVPTLL